MNFKRILVLVVVTSLLVGCVYAAGVTDFKVADTYKNVYNDSNYAIYANDKVDEGISIYKYIENDNTEDADVYEGFLHDDGDEYIVADDDLKLEKNSDNTANFTDTEYATAGISEVVEHSGEKYVVVVWAKDTGHTDFSKLMSAMDKFNKDNKVTPVVF